LKQNLGYLAKKPIIIEIYVDMKRVSHGFSQIDMLFFIAESTTLGPIIGIDHIPTFLEASFLPISWNYHYRYGAIFDIAFITFI